MKNETARREIEALDYYLQNHTSDYSEESHMAMMMASEALEITSCIKEKCAYCPHCENCDVDDETLEIKALEQQPRDCKTCNHSNNGNCAYTEECHECMWESKYDPQPCDDAISRSDVLKYAQLVRDDEGIVHEMVHVDDIKGASSVTWSGWKSVTWELPEPNTAVLLYVKYKSSGQWTYQLGMWNDSKQAWEDWRTPYRLEEEFDVIAWMELPEIYEEDNNEW